MEVQIGQIISDEIEEWISERGKIITLYKSCHDRMIRASEAYEASLRKIPLLSETASIANSKQNESGVTTFGGVSFEAYRIAKQEVGYQICKSCKFNEGGELLAAKLSDLVLKLNASDKEFLSLIQRRIDGLSINIPNSL